MAVALGVLVAMAPAFRVGTIEAQVKPSASPAVMRDAAPQPLSSPAGAAAVARIDADTSL